MMRFFAPILSMALLCAAATARAQEPAPAEVAPFTANYAIVWHGISAGTMDLDLRRNPDGGYIYVSRAHASGLFRAFFREEIRQTGWMTVDAEGVHPQRYTGDDGTKDTARDIDLEFDWKDMRVTGIAEKKPVDLALVPNAQDAMSIQIAHMTDLLRGAKISGYPMVDKNAIKDYVYTYEGPARIKTALGEMDTVVWRLQRPNNSRVTRAWHATSLNYLAVRAERMRDGDREWMMEIRSIKR